MLYLCLWTNNDYNDYDHYDDDDDDDNDDDDEFVWEYDVNLLMHFNVIVCYYQVSGYIPKLSSHICYSVTVDIDTLTADNPIVTGVFMLGWERSAAAEDYTDRASVDQYKKLKRILV